MMRRLALIPLLFAAACADTSSVNMTPVCDALPTVFSIEDLNGLDDAQIDAWAEAATCRVYLLRRDMRAVAVAGDFDQASELVAKLPQEATALRVHLELLLIAIRGAPGHEPGCESEHVNSSLLETDITAPDPYPPICHNGRDFSERLYDTITWIEEHAGFANDGQSLTMCTRHAEHVLNCLQTDEPLDWNWDGSVEEICDGRLADYGLSGGVDEAANFIAMMVEQAKR